MAMSQARLLQAQVAQYALLLRLKPAVKQTADLVTYKTTKFDFGSPISKTSVLLPCTYNIFGFDVYSQY
jgi:hypothetical protein